MRIAKIEAIPVSYPEPNDFNALRHLCLCKVTADDGRVGWGESITQFPEANFAAKAVIEGMAENLFGKRGDAHLGYEHDRDVEYVGAMREGIGPDKLLMIDNGIAIKWDVTDAVRRMRAMEEYDLTWVEEPLGAWDPEGYANLRAKTTTRMAYGEREWTLAGFERVLATGTIDVVGVDPGRAEGITGFKLVCDRIEAYRRQANAHAWSSAIVTGASLAISFSSPACNLFEFKPLRNPMQHDLVTEPFEHVDGWVYPPSGPGLGIEVIEEVVDGFRSEKVLAA